jgi:hypothetical protein
MNYDDMMTRYFDDALKIDALCHERHLPRSDSKLYTYIHVKTIESGLGVAYFDGDCATDIEAISILLGKTRISGLTFSDTHTSIQDLAEAIYFWAGSEVARIEAAAHDTLGIESVLMPELYNRLRLYLDKGFCRAKCRYYTQTIVPHLGGYTREMVDTVYAQIRTQVNEQNRIVDEMLSAHH